MMLSYIQQLKDDAGLRQRMGQAGRGGVTEQTSLRVVEDLLQWYQRGAEKRGQRPTIKVVAKILPLLWSVPFAALAIWGYEWVVSGGYSTVQ